MRLIHKKAKDREQIAPIFMGLEQIELDWLGTKC